MPDMPQPRRQQDPLSTPLNRILGAHVNVRLLRVLALNPEPIAPGELARRADLGRTTVYPVLAALEQEGIVAFVGVGATRQVKLDDRHRLARPLVALFRAEAQRLASLVKDLRGLLKDLRPRPASAWLEDLSLLEGVPGEELVIWVVGDPADLPKYTDELARDIGQLERTSGIPLSIRGVTRSELASRVKRDRERLESVTLLDGVPPLALIPQKRARGARALESHAEHDRRARRLGVAIAAKLQWDPGLVRVAQEHVDERMKSASAAE